jgi:hypothetical protein
MDLPSKFNVTQVLSFAKSDLKVSPRGLFLAAHTIDRKIADLPASVGPTITFTPGDMKWSLECLWDWKYEVNKRSNIVFQFPGMRFEKNIPYHLK